MTVRARAGGVRVLHIGRYPPPIGGVAMHVQRLHAACVARGIESDVLDVYAAQPGAEPAGGRVRVAGGGTVRRGLALLAAVASYRGDIVHFHLSELSTFGVIAVPALALSAGKKRVASILGGFVERYQAHGAATRAYLRHILGGFDHVIVANDDQRDFLARSGAVRRDRMTVVPPFLPSGAAHGDPRRAPAAVQAFCRRFAAVALVTGYCQPLYGLHTAIEALAHLPADASLGLIVHPYHVADEAYYAELQRLAGQSSRVLMTGGTMSDEEFAGLLRSVQLFLRTTRIDGDSLALREAALAGGQVIATDVVPRPRGTLLFPFGDAAALARRIEEALSDRTAGRCEAPPDTLAAILRVYEHLSSADLPRIGERSTPQGAS